MKNQKIRLSVMGMMLCVGVVFACGCSSTAVRTYSGPALPLEDVAVLTTSQDTCPVFTIDGQFKDLSRKPGCEFHLMPGEHSVEIFYQTRGVGDRLLVKKTSLKYQFQPGHVYAVMKTDQPMVDPQGYQSIAWNPNIQDQGDVVTYASENPKYFADSKAWKTLRKEHQLTKSWLEMFKISKDASIEQPQQN